MSKHTPGPWLVSGNAYGTVFVHGGEIMTSSVGTKHQRLIAGGNSHDTLTLENAHLIAAAPDLLEVARDLASMKCETIGVEDLEAGCCRTCRARAAIAKAEVPSNGD